MSIKLGQLNIWHGRLILNVTRFLETNTPDILCLQELASAPKIRDFGFNNLEVLQKKFNYPHVYFSPVQDFEMGGDKVEFGNAILSRIPLTPIKTVFTFGEYNANTQLGQPYDKAWNFQHATVQQGDATINIINHHGFWFDGDKHGNAETMRQMTMLADYIKSISGPVICTGDFNLLPNSPSLARLNSELTNLTITHQIETTRNFTSFKAVDVCDYIFVNNQVKVDQFKVHDEVISDHSYIALEFSV